MNRRQRSVVYLGVAAFLLGSTQAPLFAQPQSLNIRPSKTLTPGESTSELHCGPQAKSGPQAKRERISAQVKKAVIQRYTLQRVKKNSYRFDLLIPSSLGGAPTVKNVWPQPRKGRWNATKKNVLEQVLAVSVCDGALDEESAREAITRNWVRTYKALVILQNGGSTSPSTTLTPSAAQETPSSPVETPSLTPLSTPSIPTPTTIETTTPLPTVGASPSPDITSTLVPTRGPTVPTPSVPTTPITTIAPTLAPNVRATSTPRDTPRTFVTSTPIATATPRRAFETPTPSPTPTPNPTAIAAADRELQTYNVIPISRIELLEGARVEAQDGQFLGILSSDKTLPSSLNNRSGSYGDPNNSLSVFNPTSPYGDNFSSLSAANRFAQYPPIIYRGTTPIAYLSNNQGIFPRVELNDLLRYFNVRQ